MSDERTTVTTKCDTDIPEITYTNLTDSKIDEIIIRKHQRKRIAKYFIRDIMNAKCNGKSYEFKHQVFRMVMIRGTIISVTPRNNDKIIIAVDDGTGMISCILENNEELEMSRQNIQKEIHECTDRLKLHTDDELLRASLMMLRGTQTRLNKFLPYKCFQLGDMVQLDGKLNDYNGKRYCFIHHIFKEMDIAAEVEYLKKLCENYEIIH